MLWWDGWDTAPWLARRVRESWEKLNPGWTVQALDARTLRDHISGPAVDILFGSAKDLSLPAKSDLVRLALLSQQGGVWADATLLCMMPIDSWIYDLLEPTGFWMYHGRDHGAGPCSWFMVSTRGNYIARTWFDAAVRYWQTRSNTNDYFWMDSLFKELMGTDERFRSEWNAVPYIWGDAEGQSHMLQSTWSMTGRDPEAQKILQKRPPYVLKLSRHGLGEEYTYEGTNMGVAIAEALGQTHAPYPLHSAVYANVVPPFSGSDTVLVGADCGHGDDAKTIAGMCKDAGISMVMYDKCGFCKEAPDGVYCRPARNAGRETATFLHFVSKYYDVLPKDMIMTPTTNKHDRIRRIADIIRTPQSTGCFAHDPQPGDFMLDDYEGASVNPARARPLRKWYDKFVGDWDTDQPKPCWNGIMRTTRARIHRHPKWRYVNAFRPLEKEGHSEEGHFMERVMDGVF